MSSNLTNQKIVAKIADEYTKGKEEDILLATNGSESVEDARSITISGKRLVNIVKSNK